MSSQRGPSLELFSLVQDGSALPASLLHGIEQSIKVYLSICQLQWAVWWALIGQAFLCFSSWLGYYNGYRRQPIKQFSLGNKLLLLFKQNFFDYFYDFEFILWNKFLPCDTHSLQLCTVWNTQRLNISLFLDKGGLHHHFHPDETLILHFGVQFELECSNL